MRPFITSNSPEATLRENSNAGFITPSSLAEYNHMHDQAGKFSSGGGGRSYSAGEGGGGSAAGGEVTQSAGPRGEVTFTGPAGKYSVGTFLGQGGKHTVVKHLTDSTDTMDVSHHASMATAVSRAAAYAASGHSAFGTNPTTRSKSAATPAADIPGLSTMPIHGIAGLVRADWSKQGKGVNYAAKPYLEAMGSLSHIKDNYMADSGHSVVAYFLGNATSWKGSVAKAVKLELNKRLKNK